MKVEVNLHIYMLLTISPFLFSMSLLLLDEAMSQHFTQICLYDLTGLLVLLILCTYVTEDVTYSCQTSVDKHEHPWENLLDAWDTQLLL